MTAQAIHIDNISSDLGAMLHRAATVQGRSIEDFVLSAIWEIAQRVIEQSDVIRLTLEDQERVAKALLSPSKPTPAMERAALRHKELLCVEE